MSICTYLVTFTLNKGMNKNQWFTCGISVSKTCIHLIGVLNGVHLSSFRDLVDSLHQRNIKVFLISGGFRCIVEHVATQLGIPLHHVYANRLKFYFNGKD